MHGLEASEANGRESSRLMGELGSGRVGRGRGSRAGGREHHGRGSCIEIETKIIDLLLLLQHVMLLIHYVWIRRLISRDD